MKSYEYALDFFKKPTDKVEASDRDTIELRNEGDSADYGNVKSK